MTPILLRPIEAEFEVADRHLLEMIGFIERTTESIRPTNRRTACFSRISGRYDRLNKGLLQIAWAPRVSIEIRAQDYEVSSISHSSA